MGTGGIAIPVRTTGNLTKNRYQSKIDGNCGLTQPLPLYKSMNQTMIDEFMVSQHYALYAHTYVYGY